MNVSYIERECDVPELQNPVNVVLPSEMKCLFFLPTVRTPQDFASHKG